jgi:RNase P/RNase MRP subunit p30
MTLIENPNLEKTKQLIKNSKPPVIIQAQPKNPKYNRKIIEYGKFQSIKNIEPTSLSKLKNPNSGLNRIMAKIMTKNKISYLIDLKDLNFLDKKEKAIILSHIKHNIKLCRKAKTKIQLSNSKDKTNSQAFLLSLGASTQQTKQALEQ